MRRREGKRGNEAALQVDLVFSVEKLAGIVKSMLVIEQVLKENMFVRAVPKTGDFKGKSAVVAPIQDL